MRPTQWDDLVLEWTHSLKRTYKVVEQCGGTDNQGRDIVAYKAAAQAADRHDYQCKLDPKLLAPGDI